MFEDLLNRVKKVGMPPGTAVYTGKKTDKTSIVTVINFNSDYCQVSTGATVDAAFAKQETFGITWIDVEGLQDVNIIKALAERFNIHPLTVEDILNVSQRPKVEEFDNYLFMTLKSLLWNDHNSMISTHQLSIILGKNFILSFHETHSSVVELIKARLQGSTSQRLREQSSDYLLYRLIDATVDEYFVVLEVVGDKIEAVEKEIISAPTQQNMRSIYRLKRQLLILRKVVWPLREMVSHLLYEENGFINRFTRVYLRDAYDHIAQAIDTVETFRDMLSNLLDVYLSSLTIRMNEIMKMLTIITTIFIPITALASIYGMNLINIPLMKSPYGFAIVALLMIASVISMIFYFRRKKWI